MNEPAIPTAAQAAIRRAQPAERPVLLEIWERSARASHTFLTEDDIATLRPKVVDYLASDATEFFVICDERGAPVGFLGLGDDEIEALFLAPEQFRRGLGRSLIAEARALRPGIELTLEVNEQNDGARRFYEAMGFVVEGRSELDDNGLPFPVLHMRSPAGR